MKIFLKNNNALPSNVVKKGNAVIRAKLGVLGLLLSAITFFSAPQARANHIINFFDTPTALNSEQGEYQIGFSFYDRGGLMAYADIGINSFLSIGVKNYIDGVIGSEDISVGTPGVILKLKVTDHPAESWNVAIGYNTIYNGSFYEYDQRLYGLYAVLSRGFFYIMSYPHIFSVGIHYPLIPVSGNLSIFSSFITQFNEILATGVELSNIQFTSEEKKFYFIGNWIVALNLSEQLTLKFIMQAAQKHNDNQPPTFEFSRNILLFYKNYF